MNAKMAKYIIKRFLLALFTLWIIITLTFFIMHAVPGSPFVKQKALTPTVLRNLNAKYGLDKPLIEQYFIYLKNVVTLDFGNSIKYPVHSCADLILGGFKQSLTVGLSAAVLALTSGIVMGSVAAMTKDKWPDKLILILSTASVSLPSFVAAIILLYCLCVWWPIFPSSEISFLPIFALSLYPSAYITRLLRSSMLDVLGQDYIRTARAKGVSPFKVIFKHAMRNAITPVITYAGPMIAYIVTGSFVVEKIFTINGLGIYFVNAIKDSDYPMIMATTIFLSILMLFMNFVSDMLYKVADRRVELG